jgi:hypothetical protein
VQFAARKLWRGAAMLAAVAPLCACGKPPPTDSEMVREFFAKRAQFEALRADLCKLKFDQTIMRDPPWAAPQMLPADEARYRDRLARIGASGVRYLHGCQLFIEMWSDGAGPEAAHKKYRYGPPLYRIIDVTAPPPRDLNAYLGKRVAIASFEKNIAGDWWIELDHWR